MRNIFSSTNIEATNMHYAKKIVLFLIILVICLMTCTFYNNSLTSKFILKSLIDRSVTQLGSFRNFQFMINNEKLCSEDVYTLVLIASHPVHQDLRNVFRRTLGKPEIPGKTFKIIFPFGKLTSEVQQLMLEKESKKYGDIIQGNFIDSYHNVTLRDLMSFRFAWKFCSNAQYIVHIDDDNSVDIYKLMSTIARNKLRLQSTIGCYNLLINTTVFRSGIYAVAKDVYPSDIYQPYCEGWVYALTPSLAYKLDQQSMNNTIKQMWLNDVFITGQLLAAIGQLPFDLNITFTRNFENIDSSRWPPKYVVGPTQGNPNLTTELHYQYKRFYNLNHASFIF
ncbi:hypothetical protein CHUAL_007225 [Chamberlinius hualienensis]